MKKPLSYLELVIEIARGRSPVPEHQGPPADRVELAKKHIETIRTRLSGEPSGNELIDGVLEAGPEFLAIIWEKMSPASLTMCGDKNIEQLLYALRTVEKEKIPGDFIEAGVWRGGIPLIMRAFLRSIGDTERKVYLADSFRGLPDGAKDPNDRAAHLLLEPLLHLSAGRKQVEAAFDFFGLLDDQVILLEGWFSDTLKNLPKSPLAIARLDGDYFESTHSAIIELYPRLSPGGFLIVDDYNLPLGCKRAVDEYRSDNKITEPLIEINSQAVYWRKPK